MIIDYQHVTNINIPNMTMINQFILLKMDINFLEH